MNMSASNKNMILVLLGIIVLVAAYFLGVSPMLEQKQTIDNEVTQLQTRYNELLARKDKQAEYEAGIVTYNEKFDEKLAMFPASLNQEYTIEFIEGIRQAYDFDTTTLTLGVPEQFYILGSSTTSTDDAAAEDTEAAATETAAEAEETVIDENTYVCYTAQFPISYKGSYEGIKNVLNYVAGYRYRMTVDTTKIAYDEASDTYTGEITLTCYSIAGPDRADDQLNIDVETGVSNLFTGGGSGSSGSSSLTKYDENNGSDIASNYDLYVMLNPADSDVSAKSIGQDGKSASQITSTANEEESLKIEFYEKDGKNYVQYTLGEQSYEAEITSSEDAKIYVTSTARTSTADLSSVNVTISNTMSIPVYVKVSGDDATSPRFNVTSKSGQVKVYK